MSPSSRRAWIEIRCNHDGHSLMPVALLAEGVDRNKAKSDKTFFQKPSPSSRRAWIEIHAGRIHAQPRRSPSSRRAWIEMGFRPRFALLGAWSPSSRRAWIEI